MMLLCAAGGLVCHRPEERSGAIGRVNYLPCCSELFALFPFPVNKFLSLTLNFPKRQSEDTVLGSALPCAIFRKQLEEKTSSGIRTVLLQMSLQSQHCKRKRSSCRRVSASRYLGALGFVPNVSTDEALAPPQAAWGLLRHPTPT
ncbi:uncharacterized protein ACIQIH_011078 isoform 1-T3 [Cyanocitta cristata]